MVEVIAFAGTLTDTGKHRQTRVRLGDVVDQFHHVHGLADTGTAEQTDLAALGEGADHFYGKKGEKWRYTGKKSLKLTRLGVVKDYVYEEAVNEYIADNQGTDAIKVVASEHGLVQELMMGRVDVIISTNAVFKYSILDMKYTMDSFEDAGVLWASYGVYMGFSPASAKLEKSKVYAEIINKGISVLRDSGKLEAIMNKYGLSDWE